MKLVEKILVVHHNAAVKRRLVLTLADAGFDLRAFISGSDALDDARSEWFDLALVDAELDPSHGFTFIEQLRRIQPTLPVVLVASEMEISLIVDSIRKGITDVVPLEDDLRPVLRAALAVLRPRAADVGGLTPEELSEAEAALVRVSAAADGDDGVQADLDLHQERLRGVKERTALENRLERLGREKAALEAEMKALLAQNADSVRLQTELAELRTQRELAAAAQNAIDTKARQLAETRTEIARERSALDAARRLPSETTLVSTEDIEIERAKLREWAERIKVEETQIHQEAVQIARERRRWHEDLDVLRTQEENLREYEGRLRQLQAQLESEQVGSGGNSAPVNRPVEEPGLKTSWEKLQRAAELLEAERATFRDERMALREYDNTLKKREDKLRALEARLAAQEAVLRTPPPSEPVSTPVESMTRVLTRAPFALAKSIWSKS